MKYIWHRIQPRDTDRVKSQARSGREKRKTNILLLVQNKSSLPCLCAYNYLGLATEVSGKLDRGRVLSGLGAVG